MYFLCKDFDKCKISGMCVGSKFDNWGGRMPIDPEIDKEDHAEAAKLIENCPSKAIYKLDAK